MFCYIMPVNWQTIRNKVNEFNNKNQTKLMKRQHKTTKNKKPIFVENPG